MPGSTECLVSFVRIWSIIVEESVTRVGFVTTAKTPQLSKRFKYLHATADRFSPEMLM